MDKQAYFKMMGLCKDQALKLPKGTLSRIGGAILGAGKAAINPQTYRNAYNAAKDVAPEVKQAAAEAGRVAVPLGAAAGGTVATTLCHAYKFGEQRGAAQARNQMADKATAAYNRGLQQGAANKASQPGFWQRLLDYIKSIFK